MEMALVYRTLSRSCPSWPSPLRCSSTGAGGSGDRGSRPRFAPSLCPSSSVLTLAASLPPTALLSLQSFTAPLAAALHHPTFSCGRGRTSMNIFYIIGVVVVVLFVLGYLGLR